MLSFVPDASSSTEFLEMVTLTQELTKLLPKSTVTSLETGKN